MNQLSDEMKRDATFVLRKLKPMYVHKFDSWDGCDFESRWMPAEKLTRSGFVSGREITLATQEAMRAARAHLGWDGGTRDNVFYVPYPFERFDLGWRTNNDGPSFVATFWEVYDQRLADYSGVIHECVWPLSDKEARKYLAARREQGADAEVPSDDVLSSLMSIPDNAHLCSVESPIEAFMLEGLCDVIGLRATIANAVDISVVEKYAVWLRGTDKIIIAPQMRVGRRRVDFGLCGSCDKNGRPIVFAIECDGAQWHSSSEAVAADAVRVKELKASGVTKVIRFSGSEINKAPRRCAITAIRAIEVLAE